MLKCLPDAVFRHWDLPQVALQEIRVGFHCLVDSVVVFISPSIENLLEDRDYMLIVVTLAGQRVNYGT